MPSACRESLHARRERGGGPVPLPSFEAPTAVIAGASGSRRRAQTRLIIEEQNAAFVSTGGWCSPNNQLPYAVCSRYAGQPVNGMSSQSSRLMLREVTGKSIRQPPSRA